MPVVAPRRGLVHSRALPCPGRALGLVVLLCTCIVSHRVPDPGLLAGGGGAPGVLCSKEAPSLGVDRLRHFPRVHCETAPDSLALHRGLDRVEGWGRSRADPQACPGDGQGICLGRVRGGEGSDAVSSVVEDDDDDDDVEQNAERDGGGSSPQHGGVANVLTDSFESFEVIRLCVKGKRGEAVRWIVLIRWEYRALQGLPSSA
ncbi:hypothetical protein T484DRAFT_1760949 [Baffinella frigidus]|nr:hypothetical protein T484DRAFT_1760949 [Cryptophyta sp. CCMP2293]